MDVNRLLSDELTYELAIRGASTDNKTVAEKRSILRGILRCEKEGWSSLSPTKPANFNINAEITTCETKLNELESDIKHFDTTNTSNEFRRINSRLLHIASRLNRLNCPDAEDDNKKHLLNAKCMQLIGILCELSAAAPQHEQSLLDQPNDPLSQNPIDEANLLLPDVQELPRPTTSKRTVTHEALSPPNRNEYLQNASSSPAAHFAAALQNIRFDDDTSIPRFVPIYKWKINFDGNSSITNFLDRINELCESRRVTKQQLFHSASELFTGDALIWFRSVKPMLSTWSELEQALKTNFLPHDYETKLWYEIHRRSQGADEKVVVYIAVMENLFHRLPTKPSESERIRLIKHNLLPYFHPLLALKKINTLAELIQTCRELEEANHCAEQFRPPPTNSKFLLEPDLAYKRSHPRVAVLDTDAQVQQFVHNATNTASTSTDVLDSPTIDVVTCWNCKKPGHRSAVCSEPQRKHCYRCGLPGFTTRTCPNCSGNATGNRQQTVR